MDPNGHSIGCVAAALTSEDFEWDEFWWRTFVDLPVWSGFTFVWSEDEWRLGLLRVSALKWCSRRRFVAMNPSPKSR